MNTQETTEAAEARHGWLPDGRVDIDAVRAGTVDLADVPAILESLTDEVAHLRSVLDQIADDREAVQEVTGRRMDAMRAALARAKAAGFIDEFGDVVDAAPETGVSD